MDIKSFAMLTLKVAAAYATIALIQKMVPIPVVGAYLPKAN